MARPIFERDVRHALFPLLVSLIVIASHPPTGVAADDAGASPAAAAGQGAPQSSSAPTPGAASSSSSGGDAPAIAEWLSQTVRVRDSMAALDRPSSDGRPSARIRAGAGVKALGIVAGGQWVQIELPDQAIAYLPRAAVDFEETGGGASAPGTAAPENRSAPPVLRGPVSKVPNAATLVVAEHRIRLSGIDPGPPNALASFESWVRGQGSLLCEPDAQTGRYRCFSGTGVDVAEAAILNGAGRVGDGATLSYREREAEARQGRRGLWQGP